MTTLVSFPNLKSGAILKTESRGDHTYLRDRLEAATSRAQGHMDGRLEARNALTLCNRDTQGLLGKLFGKGSAAAVLLAVFLIGGTAWAQYTNFGAGIESCAEWTWQKNVMPRLQFKEWLGGYLTAYSFWVEKGSGPVSDGDHVGAIAWIDNYCQEKPLKYLDQAAEQLINAIRAK